MSIKTSKFIVAPLRGIDQRWEARANQASHIENMVWSDQDSWRTAFGYRRLVEDYTTDSKEGVVTGDDGPGALTLPSSSTINYYDYNSPPNSLFWFGQHGSALQWLVYENKNGGFRYFNGSKAPNDPSTIIQFVNGTLINGDPSSYRNRSGANGQDISHTYFTLYGSNLYLVNGVDAPLVFDGKKCTRAGFSTKPNQPRAYITQKTAIRSTFPTGVGHAGSNNEFKYVVTFVNERGQESRMSTASATVKIDTTENFDARDSDNATSTLTADTYRHFVVVEIPRGPIGTVARRLYRTLNLETFIEGSNVVTLPKESLFGGEYYFLDEIQDNITELYVDGLGDFDLGALTLEHDYGDFPKNSSKLAVFKNTMFVAGDTNEELRYSRPLNPEVFPPDNVFSLADNQTSLITGLYPTGDSLVVFKHRAIYLVKGDPVSGFFAQTLTTDIGCISNQTIREVPGVGLVFMANDGIYVLEGTYHSTQQTRFFKLSQGLRDIFNRVNTQFANNFRSLIYHKDREYWVTVAMDGETIPHKVFKFSYEIGAWSVYESSQVAGLIETQDHRGYLMLAGPNLVSTTASRGLYVYGGTNQLGLLGTITSTYETVNLPFNSVYENFSPVRVMSRIVGYGNTMTMEVTVNREPATVATTATVTQLRPLEDAQFPLYGSTTFDGTAVYKEHRPVVARLDFSTMHKGPVNELKLKFTCSDEMEIVNYELEGRLGTRRDVIPLTEKLGGSLKR
tara:strand:- start:300 stop:2504 length:2205 start_codon:yes stop_codon:yes gene_type:complete